ncbi:hypothetical protein GBA52_023124 [Prunus armeniaca]|nr:hypothetical protein GBA52_023124 [Prunus armeniaca]
MELHVLIVKRRRAKSYPKTHKILAENIAQLNSAIDYVSAQLHADDAPNGAAVASDEIEASI